MDLGAEATPLVSEDLHSAADDLAKDRSSLASEAATLNARRDIYASRMAAAWKMLGFKEATA